MRELLDRPAWMKSGLCAGSDPDVWFPGRGVSLRPLRTICRACPHREACAAHGMTERFGLWGGLGERSRRTLKRDGELVDPDGDAWLYDRGTGDVIVVESDKPILEPDEARALLESLRPASRTDAGAAVA